MIPEDILTIIGTFVGMLFLFIVVKLIAKITGAERDLLAISDRQLQKVMSAATTVADKIETNPSTPTIASNVDTILDSFEKAKKNLDIYLYDHPEDFELQNALSGAAKVPDYSYKLLDLIAEKNYKPASNLIKVISSLIPPLQSAIADIRQREFQQNQLKKARREHEIRKFKEEQQQKLEELKKKAEEEPKEE